jgi:diguanylate cyclase (GGDEF)-like protein/PAS domain S-box-containing protein
VNSAVRKRYHIEPDHRVGKTLEQVVGPARTEFYARYFRHVFDTGEPVRYEDDGVLWGQPIYTETVLSPIRDRDGNVEAIVGVSRDITERRQAEDALRESEERYALAVEGANDGLWDWNLRTDQLYLSPRWWAMVGLPGEARSDVSLQDWFNRIHPQDLTLLKQKIAAHVAGETSHFEDEHRIRHQDGSWRWVLSRGLGVRDSENAAYRIAGSMSDITVRKAAEAELQHGASHDALTGLPNRAYFLECLEKAMARARRRGVEEIASFGVLFLDLDRFKVINDSLGHLAGDELLIATARRLEHCVRPGDTVARLGGDEFTVLLEGIDGSQDATRVAERIGQMLTQSVDVAGYQVHTTASIGIALDAPGYNRPDDLLRDADTAMYRAKAQGRARYQMFDRDMHARALAQLRIETDLRKSIAEERFVLHYQPLVSLQDGHISGVEALIRWNHPNGTLVPPNEFISVAEETGYIVPLGWWVLKQAARQARIWNEGRPSDATIHISVNLSVRQFTQPQLLEKLGHILREEQTPPRSIVLEITESMLMDTAGSAKATLDGLRALDVGLYVDDFGTGYSSLSYLHHFPLDVLKIDRSFVAAMSTDEKHTEIVKAVVAVGHALGLSVVAEGVETHDQVVRLRELGCDCAQGYYFYRPMEVEAINALLSQGASSALH